MTFLAPSNPKICEGDTFSIQIERPRIKLERSKREEIYRRVIELAQRKVRCFSPPVLRSRKVLRKVLASEKLSRAKSPESIQDRDVRQGSGVSGKSLSYVATNILVIVLFSVRRTIKLFPNSASNINIALFISDKLIFSIKIG